MTREEAKEICRKRILSGEPFSFSLLDAHLYRESGGAQGIDGTDRWRVADAMIQHFRKKGLISFIRRGRETIWTLTDAGQEHADREGGV